MFDDLETIYKVFKDLKNGKEKVEYLEELRDKNLGYNINYENLIWFWKEYKM